MLDAGTPVYLFGLGDGIDFKGDANDVYSFRWRHFDVHLLIQQELLEDIRHVVLTTPAPV